MNDFFKKLEAFNNTNLSYENFLQDKETLKQLLMIYEIENDTKLEFVIIKMDLLNAISSTTSYKNLDRIKDEIDVIIKHKMYVWNLSIEKGRCFYLVVWLSSGNFWLPHINFKKGKTMNLLSLAQVLRAVDITDKSLEEIQGINRVEIIYRRFGANGLSGIIFRDDKGKFFLVKKRNSNLFYFL